MTNADVATSPAARQTAPLIDWFERTRARSAAIFDLLAEDAYYTRPIALRHPVVFYDGHLAAFSVNTLLRRHLGRDGIDQDLDALFARGIDPQDEESAAASGRASWPSREDVRAYTRAADARLLEALHEGPCDDGHDGHDGHDGRNWTDAVHIVIEHEAMHQETLLYIWHRLPHEQKRRPADARSLSVSLSLSLSDGRGPEYARVHVPRGTATLGADRARVPFGWDNEFPLQRIDVAGFDIDAFNVTNADYLAFIEDGGYARRDLWTPEGWGWVAASGVAHPLFWERKGPEWYWRGMFEMLPLPSSWPVYVSQAEATAYARWQGARLMTEAEFHRAAYGAPDSSERTFPWGETPPSAEHGTFDFTSWDPAPVGSHPAGQSAWGVHELVGNGWEWTSSAFDGFPGFRAHPLYPEYSAEFFDGRHYVLKGGSPATARELLRPSFRNWFRAQYPYVYATFRCVRESRVR